MSNHTRLALISVEPGARDFAIATIASGSPESTLVTTAAAGNRCKSVPVKTHVANLFPLAADKMEIEDAQLRE
jgi:hypothetical protein